LIQALKNLKFKKFCRFQKKCSYLLFLRNRKYFSSIDNASILLL